MRLIIARVPDAMVREAFLPDGLLETEISPGAERKSALNVLDRFLQRDVRRRSEQEMKMIRHNHKFVQEKSALRTIFIEHIEKKR